MLRIALSTVRNRKGSMAGALTAVVLAVVLVIACGILLESSLRDPLPVSRLAAADIVVQARPSLTGSGNTSALLTERRRIPGSLAAELQTLPGVRAAIADRSFYLQVLDRDGQPATGDDGAETAGHGWQSAALTPYTLTHGHAPRKPDDVVVDAAMVTGPLRVGDRLRILTATTPLTVTVAGVASTPAVTRGSPRTAVFFRDDVAARLSGTGGDVDLIGIRTASGADPGAVAGAVRDVLHRADLQVLTDADRGQAESPADALGREDVVAGLTVFALLATFVAVFVVSSTLALSVQQRHRELALFRAIGGTPRQVRRMVAAEAVLVALAGFAVAAPISVGAAHLLQGLFARVGMVPDGMQLRVGWLPFVAGLAIALTTTQLAVFASARRASRIRPTDALREAAVQRRLVSWRKGLVGAATLVAGILAVSVSGGGRESSAPAATLLLMVAAALLGPLLAWPFARLLGLPFMAFGNGPGLLARANTRANLTRTASLAAPVMLAVSLICTIYFGKAILERQTAAQTAQRTTAAYVLQARSGPGLPAGVAADARRIPGVAHVAAALSTSVVVAADGANLRSFPAQAVDASTLAGAIDLGVTSGSLADLRGRALAVSADSAGSFGWRLGDHVHIWLGDGTPSTLRVAAIFTRPLGFGEIVLPRPLVERHVTQQLDDTVFLAGDPGVSRSAMTAHLRRFVSAHPTVEPATRGQYEHGLADSAAQRSLAVYVLLGVIAAFCALALVNSVVMATAERARELAMLRLIGASKRQVSRMVRSETLIVLCFGLTMGSLIALPGLAVFSHGVTGSPVDGVPIKGYFGLLAVYAVLGFAASALATRGAMRMDPVAAMSARE